MRGGAPTNMSYSLSMAISNVICSITMGVRFHHGDSRYKKFMSLTEEGFKLFGSIVYVNFLPVLKYLPGLKYVMSKLDQNRGEMANFFQDNVEQHRNTFDASNIRDLVDAYLLEIEKAKAEGRELFQGKNHGMFLVFIKLKKRETCNKVMMMMMSEMVSPLSRCKCKDLWNCKRI